MNKVSRMYDDDDLGLISERNILRCAKDLDEDVTSDEVHMMMVMGDLKKIGGVDLEDFLVLMKELGLISNK